MIFDADDFGANHVISDQCQSHDCRDILDKLHYANPNFKATMFTIPGELTKELADWCKTNSSWIELGLHGFFHRDNWECSKMTYEEFNNLINKFQPMIDTYFVKGFKAPGWQISDDIYKWLLDNGWWVADQSYNNVRRPKELHAYVNHNGNFIAYDGQDAEVNGQHFHTWNCVGNGVYEMYDDLESKVKTAPAFKFISEVL